MLIERQAIDGLLRIVAREVTRYSLNGVHARPGDGGGPGEYTASDGTCLLCLPAPMASEENDFPASLGAGGPIPAGGIVVPSDLLASAAKLIPKVGRGVMPMARFIRLTYRAGEVVPATEGRAEEQKPGTVVASVLTNGHVTDLAEEEVEGTFPDWRTCALPPEGRNENAITLNPALLAALMTAFDKTDTNERRHSVQLHVAGKEDAVVIRNEDGRVGIIMPLT